MTKKVSIITCFALLFFEGGIFAAEPLPKWALGPFVRPEIAQPVISPDPASQFRCPMREEAVKWEESDTFNPAAIVKDGKIVVLYRAEDNSGQGIGKRTSRIGYAESADGITMQRRGVPVLFPSAGFADHDWPGGCEDPRVAVTEDGLYVMFYTAWNRKVARLSVATSKDLVNWEKHGLAFAKAYSGRFENLFCKSASILTTVKDGQIVIEKHGGKYFMYWGERAVYAATSENLTDWTPVLDGDGELMVLARPRSGYFDSDLTECGPPALLTDKGIVLIYNGRNSNNESRRDANYPSGSYCAGQMLFDAADPFKLKERLDRPFFQPEAPYEKSGQYVDGTVFVEGLALLGDKFYLYYGCADSQVGVAVCEYDSATYEADLLAGVPTHNPDGFEIPTDVRARIKKYNALLLSRDDVTVYDKTMMKAHTPILSIETSQKETRVRIISNIYWDWNWGFTDKDACLIDPKTGDRYMLRDIEGKPEPGRLYYYPYSLKGNAVVTTLIFPPLKKKVKKVDIYYPANFIDAPEKNNNTGGHVKNVVISKYAPAKQVQGEIIR